MEKEQEISCEQCGRTTHNEEPVCVYCQLKSVRSELYDLQLALECERIKSETHFRTFSVLSGELAAANVKIMDFEAHTLQKCDSCSNRLTAFQKHIEINDLKFKLNEAITKNKETQAKVDKYESDIYELRGAYNLAREYGAATDKAKDTIARAKKLEEALVALRNIQAKLINRGYPTDTVKVSEQPHERMHNLLKALARDIEDVIKNLA